MVFPVAVVIVPCDVITSAPFGTLLASNEEKVDDDVKVFAGASIVEERS